MRSLPEMAVGRGNVPVGGLCDPPWRESESMCGLKGSSDQCLGGLGRIAWVLKTGLEYRWEVSLAEWREKTLVDRVSLRREVARCSWVCSSGAPS